MKRATILAIAAVGALPTVASAQTVIPAMTVPSVQVDFEAMPLGGTDPGLINAAYPGANFVDIQPVAPLAAVGNYSVGFDLGRALGLDPAGSGRLFIVDPTEDFGGGNGYSFSLGMVSTQVGLSIADFNGDKNVDFYLGAALVGTSVVNGNPPTVTFYELAGGFDRVEVTGTPNYVIPELWVQTIPAPTSLSLLALGGLVLTRRRR